METFIYISTSLFSTIVFIIAIFLLIWGLRWYAQGGQYKDINTRIDNKIVIVTGCNTGIGKETVLDLARRGGKIYMACRDMKRCNEAKMDIMKKSQNPNIFAIQLDLASFESVRNFVSSFKKKESRLDILINNAGVMGMPRTLTADGFEMQFGVNHLGHFLLTNLLLDYLKKSAPSRIIVVSSLTHSWGKINKDDLNGEKSYSKLKAYSQSKLANILFTQQLSKQLSGTGVTVNALHPGVVNTEVTRYQTLGNTLCYYSMRLIFKTPKSGAQTTIKLAVDPSLEKVTGKYFRDCEMARIARQGEDEVMAVWLWKISENYTNLSRM